MKKIFLFLWYFFATLALIEIMLRIFAFVYVAQVKKLYSHKDKNYKLKILAVGESTTGGLWIENKSYPIQLQELLNKHYKCNSCVSVDITSLPGANTSSMLYYLPQYLLKTKPDIVLFMVGINDSYFYAYNIDTLLLEKLFYKNKYIYQKYKNSIRFLNEIRTLRVIKFIYTYITLSKHELLDFAVTYENAILAQRQKFMKTNIDFINIQTKDNIKKMIQITRLNNMKPVLLTYHEKLNNKIFEEISKENKIILIDNMLIFKDKKMSEYVYKQDGWHPNEKGYKLIAENVLLNLIKYGFIK